MYDCVELYLPLIMDTDLSVYDINVAVSEPSIANSNEIIKLLS